MGKFIPGPFEVRKSFSHGRTTPVIVEKIKRPAGTLCPRCSSKMKFTPGSKLTSSCPRCSGQDNT